jgi:protein-S-isoprenylcysteine O-methyltransferase Ste14
MDGTFLLFAILFVACLAIRGIYELLKEARRINPESRIIFSGILAVMILLWLSWFSLPEADPVPLGLPETVRWAGLAVVAMGTILAVGALVQLRGVENIDRLVTTGLFSRIRHPMYLGFICWLLGWSIVRDAGASFLIGLAGTGSVLWWRHLEEGRLERQFGDSYLQYRRTTWF